MKHYSKNIISIFSFSLFISLYIVSPHYASAYYIHFSDATYTNGSHTETFPLHCGDIVQLPPGGTITFLVSATSDIMNYNELCIQSCFPVCERTRSDSQQCFYLDSVRSFLRFCSLCCNTGISGLQSVF